MIQRPVEMSGFMFSVLSTLRAKQLMRGCIPRVATIQKVIMTAQLEVAAGKVAMEVVPPPE
jgi:DNA-directed RNA polymerase subunit K/omega